MPDHPIIDTHVHCERLPGSHWDSPPERLMSVMDEAGVALSILMSYTDYPNRPGGLEDIEAACRAHPTRFRGLIRLDPHAEKAGEILQDCLGNRGFVGLKLHPVAFMAPPSHPGVVALCLTCAEFNVPVLFHCGDEEFTLPWQFSSLARACPGTRIILGHMGGYLHVPEAIAVAEKHRNIFLDTSATPQVDLIRQAVDRLGVERILFASDGPGCPAALELKKIDLCGFSRRQFRKITFENACEVFGGKRLGF